MKSSDLFSHLDDSEVTSNKGGSQEPVENPAFSDQPQRDSSVTTPSS